MKLLAIDTSSDACSVALLDGDDVSEQHRIEPRAHTRILLPMIRELMAAGALKPKDLDAIVLGNGPGSFIGMRISASVAQGICFAADVPLVPVSSLAAVAAEIIEKDQAAKVLVAQDARMDEVYFAAFRRDRRGLPEPQGGEEIIAVSETREWRDSDWVAGGAGWKRYPQLAASFGQAIAGFSGITLPSARYLLGMGQRAVLDGLAIDAARLQPAYLRTKVAEPLPDSQRP